MREPLTPHEYMNDVLMTIFAFVKVNKFYVTAVAFFSWFFSVYPIEKLLVLFCIVITLDTITKINAVSIKKKLRFNPFRMYFWRQIESQGLKIMGRKIFFDYAIPILVAFCVDTLLFENALHFDLMKIKLSIPSAAILFFTGIEIWSIFENIEDAGGVNWAKKSSNWFYDWLPEKWRKVYDRISEENKKKQI